MPRTILPKHRVFWGIFCRIGAVVFLGTMAALVKLNTQAGVPLFEVIFFRGAFALIPTLIFVRMTSSFRILATRHPLAHLQRAGTGLLGMMCSFAALSILPLTEAVAIGFATPLFIALLSGPVLKEPVGRHRLGAVVVGFIGVAIILNPSLAHMRNAGSILALSGAFFAALAMLSIRQMAHEPATTTAFYFTVATTVVSGVALPFVWVMPDPDTLALLILMGIVGGIGQLLLTQAYRLAPAAVVAPFDYTQILWAGVLGYALWQEVPNLRTVIGGAVIIASGGYIVGRELRMSRRARGVPAEHREVK